MLLAAAAALTGAAVQSATGFGFALVLSPALFAVLEPYEAITALLILGGALSVLILLDGGRAGAVRWRALGPLLAAAAPGLGLGVLALELLSKPVLQVVVGIGVLAAAGWQLRRRAAGAGGGARRRSAVAAGLASGALTTSISVSGPPLVLWLEAHGLAPVELRATLAAAFLALNLSGAALLLAVGGVGQAAGPGLLLPLLGVVVAGHLAGARVFRRLDQRRFTLAVLVLVAGAGLASLAAGLAGL